MTHSQHALHTGTLNSWLTSHVTVPLAQQQCVGPTQAEPAAPAAAPWQPVWQHKAFSAAAPAQALTLKTALRQLYKRVHPDLFADYPAEQASLLSWGLTDRLSGCFSILQLLQAASNVHLHVTRCCVLTAAASAVAHCAGRERALLQAAAGKAPPELISSPNALLHANEHQVQVQQLFSTIILLSSWQHVAWTSTVVQQGEQQTPTNAEQHIQLSQQGAVFACAGLPASSAQPQHRCS